MPPLGPRSLPVTGAPALGTRPRVLSQGIVSYEAVRLRPVCPAKNPLRRRPGLKAIKKTALKAVFRQSFGAGNGTRTRGIQLGRLTLYHLSYSRILKNILTTGAEEVNRPMTASSGRSRA